MIQRKYLCIFSVLVIFYSFIFPDEVRAACRNVSVDSSLYPMPGVTQNFFISIPFTSVSPMPSSMNDFSSRRIMEVKQNLSGAVECDGNAVIVQKLESPMMDSGFMYQNAVPIYKTDLDGVGVSFHSRYASTVAYTNEGAINTDYPSAKRIHFNNSINISLNLWPLSGNTSHGVFNGASLPKAIFYVTDSASGALDSNAAIVAKFSFIGQVIYNAPTCVIEDKEVFLGKYPLSAFSGSTTTDWVDASITMNCDRAFSRSSNYSVITSGSGGSNVVLGTYNYYRTTIEAVNGFIDSGRGIMAIDSGGATGVAVQISRYQREDSFTSLEWDTRYNPAESTSTFVMPLYARYIKTGSSVTAGQANSKLLYTVEYK